VYEHTQPLPFLSFGVGGRKEKKTHLKVVKEHRVHSIGDFCVELLRLLTALEDNNAKCPSQPSAIYVFIGQYFYNYRQL